MAESKQCDNMLVKECAGTRQGARHSFGWSAATFRQRRKGASASKAGVNLSNRVLALRAAGRTIDRLPP